jgi:hypothetical protein
MTRREAKAQGLKRYFTGKPCKHGHVSDRTTVDGSCCECRRVTRESDPEGYLQYFKDRYKSKREDILRKQGVYAKKNKVAVSERVREWKKNNPDRVRVSDNKSVRKRYKNDPVYRIVKCARARLLKVFKARGSKKSTKFLELIGCSALELAAHLESLFQPGMTLDNYGEWEIDHIKPCASFDFSIPEQVRQCFHHTNLQPLWEGEHRVKSKGDFDNIMAMKGSGSYCIHT